MKEYALTLVVKNAVLLNLMESKGIKTASELARLSGVSPGIVGDFLNLTASPYRKNGKVKESAEAVAKVFNLTVDFLFPEDQLYLALDKNRFTAQVSKDEMLRLSGSCPSLMLEEQENESSKPFNGMLEDSRLTEREKLALKLKYEDGKTYKEVGQGIGRYLDDDSGKIIGSVTAARARTIVDNAERKLRKDVHDGVDLVAAAGKYNNIY